MGGHQYGFHLRRQATPTTCLDGLKHSLVITCIPESCDLKFSLFSESEHSIQNRNFSLKSNLVIYLIDVFTQLGAEFWDLGWFRDQIKKRDVMEFTERTTYCFRRSFSGSSAQLLSQANLPPPSLSLFLSLRSYRHQIPHTDEIDIFQSLLL